MPETSVDTEYHHVSALNGVIVEGLKAAIKTRWLLCCFFLLAVAVSCCCCFMMEREEIFFTDDDTII